MKWDPSSLSIEKSRWLRWWSLTDLFQTGSDTRPTTRLGTTPKEDTGEEPRSVSETHVDLSEKINTFIYYSNSWTAKAPSCSSHIAWTWRPKHDLSQSIWTWLSISLNPDLKNSFHLTHAYLYISKFLDRSVCSDFSSEHSIFFSY